MNSIMISIRPKWVASILNGKKTIEVRKTAPKDWMDYLSGKTDEKPKPKTVYIYCTKPNNSLFAVGKMFDDRIGKIAYFVDEKRYIEKYTDTGEVLNGKVLAKFTLTEVEDASRMNSGDGFRFTNDACIGYDEFLNYLYKGKEQIFGWHISDLVIFDRPRELSEFIPPKWDKCGVKDKNGLYQCDKCPYGDWANIQCKRKPLTKAPQSWCYVEVKNV